MSVKTPTFIVYTSECVVQSSVADYYTLNLGTLISRTTLKSSLIYAMLTGIEEVSVALSNTAH